MGIVVKSPHDGQPVKVRDQDVGRAVRDREGRIFYVLPRSDGNGYFGSMTRAGGEKEEQRALRHEDKETKLAEHRQAVHDATGKRRSGSRGKLVIVVLIILVAVLVYLFGPWGPYNWTNVPRGVTPAPNPIYLDPPAPPDTLPPVDPTPGPPGTPDLPGSPGLSGDA